MAIRRWVLNTAMLVGCQWALAHAYGFAQQAPSPAQVEFFESRIRPVLVERCYACHNSSTVAEGDVALDSREGIRRSSSHGTLVVPGDPDNSLLLKVVRHEIDGLEMPEDGPQLNAEVLEDFENWIRSGAVDPRDAPPSETDLVMATSWESILAKRKTWWSLQPIAAPQLPPPNRWSDHPIDRFIFQQLDKQNLEPADQADKRTLLRRLSFALTGLPPAIAEIERFTSDESPEAIGRVIDRLLASEQFGERWARHWMDLVRYADSHGSEGDPLIPNAYQYRDYLIRALNADVPYDQLVREHIAGDLLREPRIDEGLGINESAIGAAHLRFVFHGFAPTDALDEKVRFTDDQINVLGKAFLGLTLSCARCHDHKFDAISQADYYALFGILGSCRPSMQDVNLPRQQLRYQRQLIELKRDIRRVVAGQWLGELPAISLGLAKPGGDGERLLEEAQTPGHPLFVLAQMRHKSDATFAGAWEEQIAAWQRYRQMVDSDQRHANASSWDFSKPQDVEQWFSAGNGLTEPASAAGQFAIEPMGERVLLAIYPAGVFTHKLSSRHRGIFASRRFQLDDDYEVWFRLAGNGRSMVRYVVQDYPRDGTVYPINEINNDQWHLQHFDLAYWRGDQVHWEIATAKDAPVQVREEDRSWFGVREVIVRKKGASSPHDRARELDHPFFTTSMSEQPTTWSQLVGRFEQTLRRAIEAWRDSVATDQQALLLNAAMRDGLLPNTVDAIPAVKTLLESYRQFEAKIPLPTRVPGIMEADASDQPLFQRGDHRQPLDPIPRRFLAAIDDNPYKTNQSGRLQLASDLLRTDNPLAARVIVNRIWHWLYGRGIVETVDNFGQLGSKPTHPELLDYLATRLVDRGWSIKDTIRFMLTSKTWQQDSRSSNAARERDPQNRWLSHSNVRRLDAEVIRDSLIRVAGQLDEQMYGSGFATNSDSRRRSIYVTIKRNALDQFLGVFDAPVPFSTSGRRNVTNVPAQSLTMMNDPFVFELARDWGLAVQAESGFASDSARIVSMFETALGRKPGDEELNSLIHYAKESSREIREFDEWRTSTQDQISLLRYQREGILEPVRQRLIAQRNALHQVDMDPEPMARWDFQTGLADTVGDLDATLHGSATIDENGLFLDGRGYASTSPLEKPIGEKTLEAWVQLATIEQRGGAVISIEDLAGDTFDAVVFGERVPGQWMAGSNFFQRTQDFGGVTETEAVTAPVHVAIAYERGGSIRAYRNGKLYGNPYRKAELVTFAEHQSHLLFGLRHGQSSPNRLLRGRILEVRLYDRALSAPEIATSAAQQPFISAADLHAALSSEARLEIDRLGEELGRLKVELSELGDPGDANDVWTRLAHAIFNLKEFVYVR